MFEPVSQEGISLSIRNGVYMPFMYKGRQIVVHNASWSFRETIWVDDEVAVTRLGISMTSTHTIEVAGDQLTITFGYRNRMRNLFVEAKVGGVTVHEFDHQINANVNPRKAALVTAAVMIGSGVLGYGVGYLIGLLAGGA